MILKEKERIKAYGEIRMPDRVSVLFRLIICYLQQPQLLLQPHPMPPKPPFLQRQYASAMAAGTA